MHKQWEVFSDNINSYLNKNGFDEFWKCPAIAQTMYFSSMDYCKERLEFCEDVFGYDTVKKSLTYDKGPSTDLYGYKTNTNSIHQLYHLAKFVDWNCSAPDVILEVGSGYGELCRLIHSLGWNGRYIIHDLPSQERLQRWYLMDGIEKSYNIYWNQEVEECDLLIAMWSISEFPDEERKKYLDLKLKSFMMAYGESFFDVNNLDFFSLFVNKGQNEEFVKFNHPYLDNQFYLFGR
jgi:hypothetical protein